MKVTSALASGTLVLASALCVSAHVGRGFAVPEPHALKARSSHLHGRARMMARANPSSNADTAKIQDVTQECHPADFPNSEQLSKVYPKAGQIADIVVGDDEAGKMYEEILKSNVIPNIQPKPGVQQNMGISQKASDSYNTQEDPDCWWTATGCTKPKSKKLTEDLASCPEPHTWGLTFDDGPNCSHNAFYDFLQQKKLKATMFFIGTNVIDWPYQAQRGLSDGHDICVHTWSHHYMTTLNNAQVFAELYYTMRIIKDVVGVTTRCWRPPFGDVDDRVRAIAQALGLRTIIWDNDTDDWNIQPDGDAPSQKIESNYDDIIKQGTNGTTDSHGVVVLTHELTNNTMGEFLKEFPKIKKAYKNIVPLSACYNATSPYVEDKPTYSTFSDFTSGKIDAKGLPDPNNMKINVRSKVNIESEDKQNQAGGFSAASIKQAANGGNPDSSDSKKDSSSSSNGDSNSSSNPNGGSNSSDSSNGDSNASSNGDVKGSGSGGSDNASGDTQNKGANAKSSASSTKSLSPLMSLVVFVLLPVMLA